MAQPYLTPKAQSRTLIVFNRFFLLNKPRYLERIVFETSRFVNVLSEIKQIRVIFTHLKL